MTNQQKPEALRLAEHLERFRSFPDDLLAAAELRLMHSEKTELLARVDELIHQRDAAQEVAAMNAKSGASWAARVQELEAQLEAIGAGGVEPLRSLCLHKIAEPGVQPPAWWVMVREFARAVLAKWGASQPVAREPLTEDAIVDAFCVTPGLSPRQMVGCFLAGARFAERAHGITGDSNG